MNFKRLEIYVGWTCNQKCTYCMEYPHMEKAWNKKVTKYEILKYLLKYKNYGYNHVTYLGGEPFIQPVFYDALILGKKLGYTILVTTNCTTIHIDSQAKKFLPHIDELFLSVEAISIEDQQLISRTKNYVHWDLVFKNIKKYWNGNKLKANIVITQDNKNNLFDIVKYLFLNGVKDISITYPDIFTGYYSFDHIKEKIAPKYGECIDQVLQILNFSNINSIKLKIVDFPFCIFPKENIDETIKKTDDFDYSNRLKINSSGVVLNRSKIEKLRERFINGENIDRQYIHKDEDLPRERFWCDKCRDCSYLSKCWGPSIYYEKIYGLDEINPIKF